MIKTIPAKLLVAVLMTASFPASAVFAEPASTLRAAADTPADPLTAQDHDVLIVAEQLAAESSQAIERWLTTQLVTEDQLFARFYYPIAKTRPQKYSTAYDKLADRDLVAYEDKALAHSISFQYAVVTDANGYVPAHNTRFSQPQKGNMTQDYADSRSKRLLGDHATVPAARSEARYLLQRTITDGGYRAYDLSVPITVHGKHWGCARIGYRRAD